MIDDEPLVRSSARMSLEHCGYLVLAAENGRRGIELFEQVAPEIKAVVLDLTVPVMGGEETVRRLRAMRGDVRVILSSGYNEAEAVRRFEGLQLAGFIQKPYTALGSGIAGPEERVPGSR